VKKKILCGLTAEGRLSAFARRKKNARRGGQARRCLFWCSDSKEVEAKFFILDLK
jgi:hypothetical protein